MARTPAQNAAYIAVQKAIWEYHTLPHPTTVRCKGCGVLADEYHHPNGYEGKHQLDVIPLCISCHRSLHPSRVMRRTLSSEERRRRYLASLARSKVHKRVVRHGSPEALRNRLSEDQKRMMRRIWRAGTHSRTELAVLFKVHYATAARIVQGVPQRIKQ